MQKDSHTLYLEQELESLKVVLEIKTNQLHQKEKKLMEMDKLVSVTAAPLWLCILPSARLKVDHKRKAVPRKLQEHCPLLAE